MISLMFAYIQFITVIFWNFIDPVFCLLTTGILGVWSCWSNVFAMFAQELGPVWQFKDIKGNRHQLTFNMDVNNPLQNDGWSSLRVFYKLQHIHQILFRYVGNSTFQITVFSSMTAISTATKFLTNIHRLRTKHLFRVKLTKSQSQASHLVNNVPLCCFLYAIVFI